MSPAQIEKTKLLASALDRASTACITVGIATPLAAYVYDVSGFRSSIGLLGLALGVAGWIVAAIALHLGARRVLDGLPG